MGYTSQVTLNHFQLVSDNPSEARYVIIPDDVRDRCKMIRIPLRDDERASGKPGVSDAPAITF